MLNLLVSNPIIFMLVITALIISMSIHEYAHALASHKLGDNTAKLLGRLTLNPKSHIDPVGLILLIIAGFGWGRPVPVNPINLQNQKRDMAIISVAGPLSNFIMATLLAFLYHTFSGSIIIQSFLYLTILYNLILGVFNLIPVYPLDGFKVIAGILPTNLHLQWMELQRYGVYILVFMIFFNVPGVVITPIINNIMSLFRL